VLVVAILTIRDVDAFRRFEQRAAEIMTRHGGALEHAYTIQGEPLRELHVVRFPDGGAFAEYQADPDLVAMRELRNQAIAATDVWVPR